MFEYLASLLEKAWADAETKDFDERHAVQQVIEKLYRQLSNDESPQVCTFYYGRECFRPLIVKALSFNGCIQSVPQPRQTIQLGNSIHVRIKPVFRPLIEITFSELKARYRESLSKGDLDKHLQNEDIHRIRFLSELYLAADESIAVSAIGQLESLFQINAVNHALSFQSSRGKLWVGNE
ncbi:hypothetical protein [uncultured Amphritea sp.]|uniref:hypothetical protein n=1 Tax=uncultured Amphritea sp. TaxID=981605 RepID=UPI00262E6504|nr:hypothetical protein [uncultured Amphritea sp.]